MTKCKCGSPNTQYSSRTVACCAHCGEPSATFEIERLHKERDALAGVLRLIAEDFLSPDELNIAIEDEDNPHYGLPFEEALEMAYENIRQAAQNAVKGMKS